MSTKLVLEIILGVLKFPQQVLNLVRILQKTPQEKHEELMDQLKKEAEKFDETGRPTW